MRPYRAFGQVQPPRQTLALRTLELESLAVHGDTSRL
jgi:hypothetical protein